jgi:exosortase H (IPTLxxWG-CTERM-specific)
MVGFALVLADWGTGFFLDPVNDATAAMSGWIINCFGGESYVRANQITSASGGVSIGEGCNSVYATILFVAGVLAFPTTWRKKLVGVVLGTIALFVVNLIRVVTLFYLSGGDSWLFQEAHLHIWQFVIILFGGLLWLLWYDKIVGESSEATNL